MKKIIIISLFVFPFISNVNAQNNNILYKKGTISLTAGVPSIGFGSGMYSISLNARPGIFIMDKFNLGVDFGGTYMNSSIYKSYNVKPTVKYYILNKNITPFVSAGYKWEQTYFNDEQFLYHSPTIGLGVAFLNKTQNFGVEAGFEYSLKKVGVNRNFSSFVNFNFYLNRKKKDKLPK